MGKRVRAQVAGVQRERKSAARMGGEQGDNECKLQLQIAKCRLKGPESNFKREMGKGKRKGGSRERGAGLEVVSRALCIRGGSW